MNLLYLLKGGSERSVLVKKNVLYSFILQGLSILCSFLLVPLTLNYLKADEYGVWLTLNSIITWINVCDIGIGMGLKNKLAEALALEDYDLGKRYVSVTYIVLTLIMVVFFGIFIIVNHFLDWCNILNINTITSDELSIVVIVVVSFFCLNFIIKTIGVILAADQRISYSSLMSVIGSFISLLVIWVLTKVTAPSLMKVACVFSAAPVAVMLVGSFILFHGRYRRIKPDWKLFDWASAKELVSLSVSFFILQVASIIIFTTSNIIITQTIGPAEVTVYNICFKYFNIITLAFNLILGPMWPAYTNAYALGDMLWIKNGIKKSRLVWALLSVAAILMLVCSPFVYKIWVGDSVQIPFALSLVMAIYVIVGNWNNIYAQMLAGVGKIRLSIINSIFNALVFIPLSIYLSRKLGVMGVTLAMLLTILTSTIWQPIQSFKIVNNTAKGMWNK